MRTNVLFAIFRRNFTSYFSSPIGYVFICAFVLLSAVAAFWPNEFFNTNLANLDQLNDKLPWIMLVFVPAITMGIWADERRQGTDELLLTMPATDFEVVSGKYLAALAIFAVSLLFSLSNIFVLTRLGEPDIGLLVANYIGYFFLGAAMISIGIAASFLTSNLTVAFILAAAFNAPLAFANFADAIIPAEALARAVRGFGFVGQFQDFGRGIITLSGVAYFVGIVVVMLYVCMVLIGRRHWVVRRASGLFTASMLTHYRLRILSLIAIAVGVVVLAHRFDVRIDATSEQLSSVSGQTKELLGRLDPDRPVFIDAYISPEVPESFVQTRLNLLSMLREVDTIGGDAVIVRVNDTERYSREASEAQEQFGIVARPVQASTGGKIAVEEIHLGVAFMSGLDKVVVPFFDRGIPVEYELVRSISTVSQQARLRVGIVSTDATLFGGFDMQTFSSRPDEPIVTELRKQFDVVQVNATSPITETFDVLLAVQPSSLPQPQLDNLVDAIRRGQATAIFEDPFPFMDGRVPGTSQPRQPANRNPFMQQQQPPPEPKGDIRLLWTLLGVQFAESAVVWDAYNPYPKIEAFYPEFVFVGPGSGAERAVEPTSAITAGLQQVLLLFAGTLEPTPGAAATFTPLLRTGQETGLVPYDELVRRNIFGGAALNPQRRHVPTRTSYVLAARIQGASPAAGEDDAPDEAASAAKPLDVVLVADLDCLQSAFFMVRAAGRDTEAPVTFDFDNVTFVLNALDELAGDDRFIPIRSRRPRHRTLSVVESRTEAARAAANDERRDFVDAFEAQRAAEEEKLNAELAKLQERGGVDAREMGLEVAMKTQVGQNRLQARIEALERDRDREVERIERDLALEIRQVQNRYKIAAVGLPPIPPLLVAFVVFLRRRTLERVGVPKSRLRKLDAQRRLERGRSGPVNETARTGVFIVVAAVAIVIAFFARPAAPEREAFDDSGERFFDEFDPLDARSLEIVSWDDETATVQAFKVAQVDGVWSIPSHEDYPADAEEQLASAAASVMDLVKGPKVSDRAADHEMLGVIDPISENVDGAGGVEGGGVGTRVTIGDASGAALADFLVGKSVKDGEGLRYVRMPGRDRVYSVKVDTANLTTRFEEWIEDDLLQLSPVDIRKIVINDYTIDEINQRLLQGDVMSLSYDEGSSAWSMEGLAENESLATAKVNELKNAIDGLKIIDVHRKPAGLSAELRADDALELDAQAVRSLSQRGFYIAQSSLVSNQGETMVHLKDGVTYVLRFGEIARADRAGGELGDPAKPGEAGEGPAGPEAEPEEGSARYLFIAAQFDPDIVAEPEYEALPELPAGAEEMPPPDEGDEEALKAYDEVQSLKAIRERVQTENDELREDHEQRLEAGRRRVAELNDRFADWYYVISDSVYRKLRLKRTDLVEVAADEGAGG